MRQLIHLFAIIIVLLSVGCEEALKNPKMEEALKLSWQGPGFAPPENPQLYWVYFDIPLKTTMIYNGSDWDTMAVSGLDAVGMSWLGTLDGFPDAAPENASFLNSLDNTTYIFNGESWDPVSLSGDDALSVQWQGYLPQAPDNPVRNWTYYNTTNKVSYIYSGNDWEVLTLSGIDGMAMTWLGSHPSAPTDPVKHDAYYNSSNGISYLYTDGEWHLISKDGLEGDPGDLIYWQGVLAEAPEDAQVNWVFQDEATGYCYIYDGEAWQIFSSAGRNGVVVRWKGEYVKHPESPRVNDAYRNKVDKNCYIFNGVDWDLLSVGGNPGEDGIDGRTVKWQAGDYTSHPEDPEEYWAYFNLLDSKSYIYRDGWWRILAKSGEDGATFNWLGEFSSAPAGEKYDAYYNTSTQNTYYKDSYSWKILCENGVDGSNGSTLIWKGNSSFHLPNAEVNWFYYNTVDECTYLYQRRSGYKYSYSYYWKVIAQSGKDGIDAEKQSDIVCAWVANGDSLVLNHDMNSLDMAIVGQYRDSKGNIHFADTKDPEWESAFETISNNDAYSTSLSYTERGITPLSNGGAAVWMVVDTGVAARGFYSIMDPTGSHVGTFQVVDAPVKSLNCMELDDGTIICSYIDSSNKVVVTSHQDNYEAFTTEVRAEPTRAVKMKRDNSGNIIFLFMAKNEIISTMRFEQQVFTQESYTPAEGTVSTNLGVGFGDTTLENSMDMLAMSDGNIAVVYLDGEVKTAIVKTSTNTLAPSHSIPFDDFVFEIGSLCESASQNLYFSALYENGTAQKGAVVFEISQRGELVNSYEIELGSRSVQMIPIEDDRLALYYYLPEITFYSYGTPYTVGGYTRMKTVDMAFNEYSCENLSSEITEGNMVKGVNGDLWIGYTKGSNPAITGLAHLVKGGTPNLEVRRTNQNSACIINNTGRLLDLKLSVIR